MAMKPEKASQETTLVLATQGSSWGHARMMLRVAARYKSKKRVKTQEGKTMTVYQYSDRQVALRHAEKAKRLESLKSNIGKLRTKVRKDLKSSDPEKKLLALAVALMDETHERVGNSQSAEDGHFGVTGWQKGHVSFGRNHVTVKYTGKSGVDHKKKITDATIRKALRDAYEAVEGEDACLFEWEGGKVTAEKVNEYLEPFDISAKDIRGFGANVLMREKLRAARKGKLPEDKKERTKLLKEEFKKALEETAEEVGHTASMLRNNYLTPGTEDAYVEKGEVMEGFVKEASLAETIVWRFLRP